MSVTFWKISFLSIHSLLSVKTVDSLSTWILLFPGIWAAEIQISLWIQNSQISLATELHPIECASHRVNIVNSSGIVRLNAYVYRCHIKTRFSNQGIQPWVRDNVIFWFSFSPSASCFFPTDDCTPTLAWGISIRGNVNLCLWCTNRIFSCLNIIAPPP